MEEKLKYAASEGQNSFIDPFNRDEVVADQDKDGGGNGHIQNLQIEDTEFVA